MKELDRRNPPPPNPPEGRPNPPIPPEYDEVTPNMLFPPITGAVGAMTSRLNFRNNSYLD